MKISKRIKQFMAVLGVFLVVLATNLIDKNNFLRVEESVDKIYNERLLAKELLLDVSIKFHEKELAYALNDSIYLKAQNDKVNKEIKELLTLFNRTEATKDEKYILAELNKNHSDLIALESKSILKDTLYSSNCALIFKDINANISALSSEQIKEGKQQKNHAAEAVKTVKLFSKGEIYLLIFLGIVLQFIILYNPKKGLEESE